MNELNQFYEGQNLPTMTRLALFHEDDFQIRGKEGFSQE